MHRPQKNRGGAEKEVPGSRAAEEQDRQQQYNLKSSILQTVTRLEARAVRSYHFVPQHENPWDEN